MKVKILIETEPESPYQRTDIWYQEHLKEVDIDDAGKRWVERLLRVKGQQLKVNMELSEFLKINRYI